MRRWFRSLQAQLFLWAILPVTLVIIALAFTGIYTHQREMRDFVAERDLALARAIAQMIEGWLGYGFIAADGQGLELWIPRVTQDMPGALVIDGSGRALAHPDAGQVGAVLRDDPGVEAALRQRAGSAIVNDERGDPVLITFTPVNGTDWLVLIREPVAGFISPVLRFSSLGPIIAVVAAIVSLLILTFGWRTIVSPMQRLVRAAGQISWGNYTAIEEPGAGVEEIRELHRALAEMVERIRGYEAGIRDYLGAMTMGQEAERARFAREIHDGPLQEIIALGQQAEMARRFVERGETKRAQALLEEMRGAQVTTVEELRRIIGALRPIYLEDLGFVPALEMLVHNATERTSAQVRLEYGGGIRRLSPAAELAAYRIAQEALTNAIQHAQAHEIVVHVACNAEGLLLSVRDDGVGFTLPERPDVLTQAGHFGLLGIQERVSLLDGMLDIHTAPGEGTEITARIPDCRPQPSREGYRSRSGSKTA